MTHTILVVDDESDYLDIAAALLSAEGHTVLKASTGAEGLAKAAAHKPELIVLDIGLPDIGGLDVNRRLKKDPATAGIPVLLFTVRSELDLVDKALKEGAAEFILKPFDAGRFVLTVKKHLKK